MFFLSTNGIDNIDPVTDPLFTATRAVNKTLNNGAVATRYISTAYTSAMVRHFFLVSFRVVLSRS